MSLISQIFLENLSGRIQPTTRGGGLKWLVLVEEGGGKTPKMVSLVGEGERVPEILSLVGEGGGSLKWLV